MTNIINSFFIILYWICFIGASFLEKYYLTTNEYNSGWLALFGIISIWAFDKKIRFTIVYISSLLLALTEPNNNIVSFLWNALISTTAIYMFYIIFSMKIILKKIYNFITIKLVGYFINIKNKCKIIINYFISDKNIIFYLLSIIFLLIGFCDLSDSYYVFMKIFLFITAVYNLYISYKSNIIFTMWLLFAIIYNPIAPLDLYKDMWMIIDSLLITFIGYQLYKRNIK